MEPLRTQCTLQAPLYHCGSSLCENADVYGSTGAISGPARQVLCADGFHQSANAQNAHRPFHVVGTCTVSRTASCSQREIRRSLRYTNEEDRKTLRRYWTTACQVARTTGTHCSGLAVAEYVCRAVDWNNPSRVRGPHRRAGRGASAPDPARVCSLLQYRENAPVMGPGCSSLSPGSADRTHPVARLGWRAASRIRPDLGFRTHSRLPIRECTDHPRAPPDLAQDALERVVGSDTPPVLLREGVVGQGLLDSPLQQVGGL